MSSEFGNYLKISLFGESHGNAVGVTIHNLPPGETVDIDEIERILARRSGGRQFTTERKERDEVCFISGVYNGKTTGAPLCAIIKNEDFIPRDYEKIKTLPRPSHADYPAYVKYKGFNDERGGGHFSGRLTAPVCAAGALCMQILNRRGVGIGAHIYSVYDIYDTPFNTNKVSCELFDSIKYKTLPVVNDDIINKMLDKITEAAGNSDSVGGIVECAVTGLKAGIGAPVFDGVENRLSAAVFGIGAVRGIEFGAGFSAPLMYGSEHNDPYFIENGEIKTKTNNHGGILGGITSGMPVIFRVAFKPTPSIGKTQDTIDLKTMTDQKITIEGRHDPCIVPRAVPCVESITAVTILDLLLENDTDGR